MEQEKFLMERTLSILLMKFAKNLNRDVNLFPGAKLYELRLNSRFSTSTDTDSKEQVQISV